MAQLIFQNRNLLQCNIYNVLIKWTVWGTTYGDESSYDFRDVMDVLQDIELQHGTLRWGVEGIFFFFFSSPESSTSAVRGGLGQEMQNVN